MQPDWRAIPAITRTYGIKGLATWASAWGRYYIHRHTAGQARRARGHADITIRDWTCSFITKTRTTNTATYYFENHEADAIDAFLKRVDKDDRVFDIGANMGFTTCFAAAAADHVVAAEPYKPNVRLLHDHLERNGHSNVTVKEVAVSDGIVSHTVPVSGQPQQHVTGDGSTETTAVTTGDALAAEHGTPNAVIIDVEGAEGNVLNGLTKTLADSALHTVLVEVHHAMSMRRPSCEEYGHSRDDVEAILRDNGFETQEVGQMPGKTQLLATRPKQLATPRDNNAA